MSRLRPLTLSPRWQLAAFVVLMMVAAWLVWNAITPGGIDFISYWAAAKLVISGAPADAYNVEVHRAMEAQVADFAGQMTYPYPPPYFFFIIPFAFLPFPIAAMVWVALSVVIYALTVRRFLPGFMWAALAFPPILVCGIIGQNGMLSASLMIAGLGLLGKRSFVAGLLFGMVAMKPQLAVLIPLLLLAMRDWKAIAGAICGFGGICLLSLAVFGLEPWRGFLGMLPLYGSLAAQGQVGWYRIASVYAALRMLGIDAGPAIILHALPALAAVWMVWRTGADKALAPARGAALVIATVLLSPYLYMYDQIIMVIAIVWALRTSLPERSAVHLYLVSLLAFGMMVSDYPLANLIPIVPLILLGFLWWRTGELTRAMRMLGAFRRQALAH